MLARTKILCGVLLAATLFSCTMIPDQGPSRTKREVTPPPPIEELDGMLEAQLRVEYSRAKRRGRDGVEWRRYEKAVRDAIFAKHPEWPMAHKSAVSRGEVALGMTSDQVRLSRGRPSDVNRSVGSWGVHEQWVYRKTNLKNEYVYLENGVVTSWQD